MIPVCHLETLKRTRDEVEFTNRDLFLALGIAILRLETHKCNIVEIKSTTIQTDYYDQYLHESQNEKYGK